MRKLVVLAAAVVALSARAEQKNVQLLTGMTDLQLQRTMNMMRASLGGVHCDYCHVVDEKTGWDFASDAKKEKKTAREMIAMVLKINKEQFGGKTEVSCWTCHRGATHPAAVVPLPQAAPPFPTPKPARPTLPALDEVVKNYAAALGDATKLRKPRIMKGTRENFDGKQVPIEVQQSGPRWHITAETPNGRVEQIVNESGGWSKTAKEVSAFPDTGLENFRDVAESLEITLPSAIPSDARVTGKETLGTGEAVIVAFRQGGARQRLYFDQLTNLLVRRVVMRDTPVGEVPQQTDFTDWSDFGGTRFPQMVKTSLVDPWAGSTRRYTHVTFDAKIGEAAFAKPKG